MPVPYIVLIAILSFWAASRLMASANSARLGPIEAQQRIGAGNLTILDVREPRELRSGILPGALSFPLSQLSTRLGQVPAGPLLVYCASGRRSAFAAAQLKRAGRAEVWNLRGGVAAWSQHGLPLVTGHS